MKQGLRRDVPLAAYVNRVLGPAPDPTDASGEEIDAMEAALDEKPAAVPSQEEGA